MHCSEGRLTLAELEERLGEAYGARTLRDLIAPMRELPQVPPISPPLPVRHRPPAPTRPSRSEGLRAHVASYVAVNALLVIIWALTGAGYFWPIWPILGWGVGIASHAMACTFAKGHPKAGGV